MAEEQDFDVFVSYAHADNEVPMGSSMAAGWVTAFAKNLNTGPGVLQKRLFIDHQLKPGDDFGADLMTRVERSSVLVLLLSPNYVNSRWCGMEVERFVQAHSADPDKPSSVFVIELWPYESLLIRPPVIERLRKRLFVSKFWFKPADASAPSVAGYPSPLDGQPEGKALYWRVLNELQSAIDKQVLDLRAARSAPAVGAAPQRPTVQAAPTAGPARGSLGTVLLADTTDDLETERNKVRAILEPEGVLVLPEGDYVALSQPEFDAAVQADLDRAGLFIQLLSPTAGRKGRFDLPLPQLQYQRAVASGKPVMQWASRQPAPGDVADEGHARLFDTETLRVTHLTDFANSVVTRLRAEQAKLERAADELRRQQAQALSDVAVVRPGPTPPRQPKPFIFIDDKGGEPEITQLVRGLLKEHNFTWRSGEPPNGDIQEWLRPCVAGLTIYTNPNKRDLAQSRLIHFLNQMAAGEFAMEHWGVFLREATLATGLEIEMDGLVDVNEQDLGDFLRRVAG